MLPKQNRFCSADFKRMRGARVLHSPHFFARIQNSAHTAEANAAAVVSSAVAKKAVARNLLRRRIYACFHPLLSSLQGVHLVIQAKQGAAALPFAEMKKELTELLQRI